MGSLYRPKYPHPEGEVITKTGKRYKVSKVWWMKYRVNGHLFCESTDTTTEREAKRLLARRMGAAAEGRPITPRADKIRLSELAEDLLNDYRANERPSLDRLGYSLKHLLPFFGATQTVVEDKSRWVGGKFATTLTTADANGYIAHRQKERAVNGTINRELGALKRMYSLALTAGKLHQAPNIPHLREDNVRTGFFDREQFEAVRRHLPDYARPVVTFAYITGWRLKSEILPLQWRQVDFKAGTVRLEPGTTKNREGRTFIMTPALRAVLEKQRERTDWVQLEQGRIIPWVFHRDGEPIKGFRRAWKTACRKAGVPGRIPHDFRRSAVRNLERAGVPRSTAMKMVGHKTEAIYRRYAIVDEAMMREGAEKLARYESGNNLESLGKVAEQGKELGKVASNQSLQGNLPTSKSLDSMVGGTGLEPVTSAV